VESRLVAPISNLIATGQVGAGDEIAIELDAARGRLMFLKECQEPQTGAAAGQAASAA